MDPIEISRPEYSQCPLHYERSGKAVLNESLRVLLIGSHLGYNVEHYAKMALERLGCEVCFVGYRDIFGPMATPMRMTITRSRSMIRLLEPLVLRRFDKLLRKVARDFRPQLALAIKGEAILPETVKWISSNLGSITALWCTDDPRYFGSFVKHVAPSYDCVFTASEGALPFYEGIGIANVRVVPFACEPSIHRRILLSPEETREMGSEVSFVGTYYPNRGRLLGQLAQHVELSVWGPYWRLSRVKAHIHPAVHGPEMVKVLNGSKITINIQHPDHLRYMTNMRVFEATGSGVFILTDRSLGIEKLFRIGKEVVCYSSVDELNTLVGYYLDHEAERRGIAENGQLRAHRDHTYDRRIIDILDSTRLLK